MEKRREGDEWSDEWLRALRRYLAGRSERPEIEDVVSYWRQTPGASWQQLRWGLGALGRGGHQGPPASVADFLAEYARAVGAKRLLDPFVTSPLLLAGVVEDLPGAEAVALGPQESLNQLGRELKPTLDWRTGHPPDLLDALEVEFDFIVGSPPLGLRHDGQYPVREGVGEYAFSLLADLASRVTPGGRIVLLLADGFLSRREAIRARELLAESGLFMEAAVSVEHGIPDSEIATHLFVFTRRAPDDKLFVARLGPGIEVSAIVRNLIDRKAGAALELGWLYDRDKYRGWAAASAERDLIEALGFSQHPVMSLADLTTDITRHKGGGEVTANAVYLPQWPGGQASTTPPRKEKRNVFQLTIDPCLALADYVAGWLNEPLGRTARRAYATGATVQRIALPDVGALLLLVPPIDEQAKLIRSDQELRLIGREIAQRRSELWLGRVSVEEASRLVGRIEAIGENEETTAFPSLDDWIEGLPFPLAAIAYDFHAVNDTQVKVDRLQHLFEAFAIFGVTVLFSAVKRDAQLYEELAGKLRRAGKRHAVLDRADYNTWVDLGRSLCKPVRLLLTDESGPEDLVALFGSIDRQFIERLVAQDFWESVDAARTLRNARSHGGAEGEKERRAKLERLEGALLGLRQATVGLFDDVEVVRPGRSEEGDDGIFIFDRAERVAGSRRTFREREVHATSSMKSKGLHLVSASGLVHAPLQLLPFITLHAPPESDESAAFFYNRRADETEGIGYRYVSYHYEAQPESFIADPVIDAILDDLKPI